MTRPLAIRAGNILVKNRAFYDQGDGLTIPGIGRNGHHSEDAVKIDPVLREVLNRGAEAVLRDRENAKLRLVSEIAESNRQTLADLDNRQPDQGEPEEHERSALPFGERGIEHDGEHFNNQRRPGLDRNHNRKSSHGALFRTTPYVPHDPIRVQRGFNQSKVCPPIFLGSTLFEENSTQSRHMQPVVITLSPVTSSGPNRGPLKLVILLAEQEGGIHVKVEGRGNVLASLGWIGTLERETTSLRVFGKLYYPPPGFAARLLDGKRHHLGRHSLNVSFS